MSLRGRLLATMITLVTLGLIASDVATWAALRSFLLERVDRQIGGVADGAPEFLLRARAPGPGLAPGAPRRLPSSMLVIQLRDPEGRVIGGLAEADGPDLTAIGPAVFEHLRTRPGIPTSIREGRAGHLRVRAEVLPDGNVLLVGAPLAEIDRTLGRLVLIEVLVTLAVVATLGLLAWRLVRVGLRPLDQMTSTAAAIAAGDLTRRVLEADERTEVGRLGRALNTMLARIEAAFAYRRASEEQLRRFVGDASHELRTPITSIRGYAELFRRGASDRPVDLALAMRRIEDEAERMGVLVEELLLLARLDQGRPLERGRVDLREVAVDAAFDAKAVEPERSISVEAERPVTVLGDEARLRQVAANLLANVRMHTPASAEVTVRAATDGPVGVIEVADSGMGLEPQEAAQVFERFYRTDPSRSRERGGAGLGLSIVAAIAQAHGGSASVTSARGEGATFRVELPLAPPEQDGAPAAQRPAWSAAQPARPSGKPASTG